MTHYFTVCTLPSSINLLVASDILLTAFDETAGAQLYRAIPEHDGMYMAVLASQACYK